MVKEGRRERGWGKERGKGKWRRAEEREGIFGDACPDVAPLQVN